MIRWGWSGMSHDAALAVMVDDEVVYASHGERYSRVKNDRNLHYKQVGEALKWGKPDRVYYYERPWLKKLRQFRTGQHKLLWKQSPASYMHELGINNIQITAHHHHSHAAYGYFTSPYDDADVLVIDSIGEFETLSYWRAHGKQLRRVMSQSYPNSVGLWYSAMTQRLGLKPQEHEYILMGMAATGDPTRLYWTIRDDFFTELPSIENFNVTFKHNLHRGCMWWRPELNTVQDFADIAAATQRIYEEILQGLLTYTSNISTTDNLVLVGGCALNCVANTQAYQKYQRVWVPPNPGDAGSSLGAILAHNPQRVQLNDAYLGTNIEGGYPIDDIINDLKTNGVSAVATGKAEYGPRALGNRSILADPRLPDVKDRVNRLKQRESFRPFAPAILSEHVGDYFDIPHRHWRADYMQFAVPCLEPAKYPGIIHVDGTSRVQTVGTAGGFRSLLEQWYAETGCPMLLNTSLNIKGEPLVNTFEDAQRWSKVHGVEIRTPNV